MHGLHGLPEATLGVSFACERVLQGSQVLPIWSIIPTTATVSGTSSIPRNDTDNYSYKADMLLCVCSEGHSLGCWSDFAEIILTWNLWGFTSRIVTKVQATPSPAPRLFEDVGLFNMAQLACRTFGLQGLASLPTNMRKRGPIYGNSHIGSSCRDQL